MAKRRSTILLLDEDSMTLELYKRELASDYLLITCRTVEEVQDLLQKQKFDILIIEPMGLGEKGRTLINNIKADATISSIPIVICSTQNIDRILLERGVIAYLVKPIIPMDLHAVIRQILSQA